MSDDLIERLREKAKGWPWDKTKPGSVICNPDLLAGEAADALAAKDKAISEMRAELERHQDEEDKAAREMQAVIQGLRDRATAAEAQLERVRKALGEFSDWCQQQASNMGAVDGYDYRSGEEAAYRHASIEAGKRARALSHDEPADLGVGG